MKKTTLISVLLFAFTLLTYSQNTSKTNYTVNGTVVDSISRETVPFCTVSASGIKTPMNYLKRIAADVNGKFNLELNSPDTILLKFESVGMTTKTKEVIISDKITDLGEIELQPSDKTLSEVTVSASKPLVKVDLDKIEYDMQSDPESATSSVLEMLRKVPMITVDADENILLKGKSNYKIFMNGKPTNMISNNPSQVLKSIPANTIKKIEVITEPGAKYEAEGLAGIINIVTESAIKGYSGSVNAGIDTRGSYNGGVYFTTKIGKLGITTNLNRGSFRNPDNNSDYYRLNKVDNSELNQNGTSAYTGIYNGGNVSISYEVDTFNLVTINGNGWGGNYTGKSKTTSTLSDVNKNILKKYDQYTNTYGNWGGYDVGVDYQHSFMKPDKMLTFSYKLSHSPDGSENNTWIDTTTAVNYSIPQRNIKSNSNSDEHTFQIDYTEPFNKKHVMEFGLKYILRNNNSINTYQMYDESLQEWTSIDGMTDNDFIHHQDILGTYGSYTFKTKKFSARAGVRFEHTKSSITYKNIPERNFTPPSFNNLVPSINFNYKMTDMSNIQLSYTQRLNRPSIWYLNPFIDNSDPYNIQIGNPKLNTEIGNSFSLNYGYVNTKFNMNISAYHSFTNNSIERVSTLSGDTLKSTYENIGEDRNTGISTYFRWQITPKLNINFNGNTNYAFLSDGKGNQNEGFDYGGSLNGAYEFSKSWRLNWYSGLHKQGVSLQGSGGSFLYYGLSANKSFFDKKLNLSLGANTFLQKYFVYQQHSETDTYKSESIYRRFAPNLRFNISYRFGQMKEQIKTTKKTITNNDVKAGEGNNSGGGSSQGM